MSTIPKLDLLSTADDIKQEIDICFSTSLCEIYSYTKRHVCKVISGGKKRKKINSYSLPRGRGVNLRNAWCSQVDFRPNFVPICSMELSWPLTSMTRGIWYLVWSRTTKMNSCLALSISLSRLKAREKQSYQRDSLKDQTFCFYKKQQFLRWQVHLKQWGVWGGGSSRSMVNFPAWSHHQRRTDILQTFGRRAYIWI